MSHHSFNFSISLICLFICIYLYKTTIQLTHNINDINNNIMKISDQVMTLNHTSHILSNELILLTNQVSILERQIVNSTKTFNIISGNFSWSFCTTIWQGQFYNNITCLIPFNTTFITQPTVLFKSLCDGGLAQRTIPLFYNNPASCCYSDIRYLSTIINITHISFSGRSDYICGLSVWYAYGYVH